MNKLKTACFIMLAFVFFGCEEEKLDIDKFGSISGIILDGESYEPIMGVLLATNPASATAVTDEKGNFEFPKVIEGDVAITARKKDFLTNSVSVAVYDSEATEVTFFLLKDEKNIGSVIIYDPIPGNGAVDQNKSFTFKWKVDQENRSKELEYTVYIFESNSTVQQIVGENLNVKEVTVNGLKPNTTYYWYVVAKFEGSNVSNSPTWTFQTAKDTDSGSGN
jgi:hypothetical protein